MRLDNTKARRPVASRVRTVTPMTQPSSKYEAMNRPSQKVIDVGAALHRAGLNLGLFKPDRG